VTCVLNFVKLHESKVTNVLHIVLCMTTKINIKRQKLEISKKE
jgi:hypothetical protein